MLHALATNNFLCYQLYIICTCDNRLLRQDNKLVIDESISKFGPLTPEKGEID